MEPTTIILVTGAPGVGKTSAGRHLIEYCPSQSALVDTDAVAGIHPWAVSDAFYDLAAANLTACVRNFREWGAKVVVITGVILPGMIYSRLEGLLRDEDFNWRVFGLWARPEVIRSRIQSDDKWQDGDTRLSFLELNEQLRHLPDCTLIDTSDINLPDVVREIATQVGLWREPPKRDDQDTRLSLATTEVSELCTNVLAQRNVPEPVANRVVQTLIASELEGHPSHGLLRLIEYVETMREGLIRPDVEPEVKEVSRCARVIDGCRSFGVVSADCVSSQLLEMLATEPIAVVGLHNSNHIGRLAHLADPVARANFVVLGFVNYLGAGQRVPPWGGAEGRFCTNPILFAFPSDDEPIICDLTTSIVSEGKIRAHLLRGDHVPRGWLLDADWLPVTDPSRLYTSPPTAMLAPLGGSVGYKGFAMSLATEILAGILTGAGFVKPKIPMGGNGGLFIGLNPELLGQSNEAVLDGIRQLEEYTITCPRARGFASIDLPGKRSGECLEQNQQSGYLKVDREVWRQLQQLNGTQER